MNRAYTAFSKRSLPWEREQLKIMFQYALMLVAASIAGWILPRFLSDGVWQSAQTAIASHFDAPFVELNSTRQAVSKVFSFFCPTLVCVGMVGIFSFSSLSCLISDGVLVYLGMRTGCTVSMLFAMSNGSTPFPYRPEPVCVFLFILFKLLLLFFFFIYAVQAAKQAYQMRRYSKEGRTVFEPQTVGILLLQTLLCVAVLFLLHLLYAYSIYFVSK